MQKLNNKQQRWVAIGLLFSAVILISVAIFIPWYGAINKTMEDIDSLIFRIKRYERIISSRGEVLSAIEQGRTDINSLGYLYTQSTASLAAAELQKRLKEIIVAAGGELSSTQVLPHKEENGLVSITVKVKVVGNMEMLRSLLYEIDIEKPLMSINQISIVPSPKRIGKRVLSAKNSGTVTLQLNVVGYMKKEM
jgi:general secretion pathway protein M